MRFKGNGANGCGTVAVSVTLVYCSKDPLPVIRFIMEIVLIKILLMDQQIVETVVFFCADSFHESIDIRQFHLIDDNIIFDKDNILFVIHPEIPLGSMLGLGFV